MKNSNLYIYIISIIFIFSACDKSFLEKRKDKAQLIPETLEDAELLLDNTTQLFNNSAGLQIIAGDEFVTDDAVLAGLSTIPERSSYLWSVDFYEGSTYIFDWGIPYKQIYYANTVLELLEKTKEGSPLVGDRKAILRGTALFHRGLAFYNLAQLFAANYKPGINDGDLGIPLKLTGNVHEKLTRASLKETYDRIITDLVEAADLLPLEVSVLTRPSKMSANALLARIYLDISVFDKAEVYADKVIPKLHLLDYNTIPQTSSTAKLFPLTLPKGNPEIAFFCFATNYSFFSNAGVVVDPLLYETYEAGDLRRELFFTLLSDGQSVRFRGSYTSTHTSSLFTGLALDELLLIKAECLARKNQGKEAVDLLNTLRRTRFTSTGYYDLSYEDDSDAIVKVLNERKKQMLARGMRWADLKRLNREDRYQTILERELTSGDRILLPNDPRYIFPIPADEIIKHGIEQNER